MRNYFTFAGRASTEFGIYTNGRETFGSPARSYEVVTVPGRNGDLFYDNKRFENYDLKYPASFIFEDFKTNISEFRNYMFSRTGYQRLEDTYNPDEFRMAVFKDAFEPAVKDSHDFAQFDIVFNCKPQRFLKSGEEPLVFTGSSFSITNPTYFPAKPLIRVYGNGTLRIGNVSIEIKDNNNYDYCDIDFETSNAYYGPTSLNRKVTLSQLDYPSLEPGVNNCTKSGITRIEVKPRWYII